MFKFIASVIFFVLAYCFAQNESDIIVQFEKIPKDIVLQRYFYGNILSFVSGCFGIALLAMSIDDYIKK